MYHMIIRPHPRVSLQCWNHPLLGHVGQEIDETLNGQPAPAKQHGLKPIPGGLQLPLPLLDLLLLMFCYHQKCPKWATCGSPLGEGKVEEYTAILRPDEPYL